MVDKNTEEFNILRDLLHEIRTDQKEIYGMINEDRRKVAELKQSEENYKAAIPWLLTLWGILQGAFTWLLSMLFQRHQA